MSDVLTWLWQGGLVALALAGALRAAPVLRLTGAMRCALCWWGLGVVLVLPLVPATLRALPPAVPEAGRLAAPAAEVLTLPGVPLPVTVGLVTVWVLSVAVGVARLALDLRRLRRMKRRARRMPESAQQRLPLWLGLRNQGRRARLAVVDDHVAAAVLGFRRPVIVVPRTLLEALTDAELDQVVAHEHAHVARRDDWADLLQRLIAVPFGLHPAIWLIGKWIRRERELAADERVAARTGVPRAYARCLARVAETMTCPEAPCLAPGAVRSRHELGRRVAHLIDDGWAFAGRSPRRALVAVAAVATLVALPLGGRGPAVELGVDGAVATQVLVGPPMSMTPPSPGRVAHPVAGGESRAERRPRVSGVRLPARPAPARLATRRFGAVPPSLPVAARSTGFVGLTGPAAPLPVHDLGLPAHGVAVVLPERVAEVGESHWAWAGRAGTSLGSWFARAGRTTAGTFRGLGSSLTRTVTGRR